MREQEFFSRVRRAGGRAWLVGGAVRDLLIGRAPHDRDYVVCRLTEKKFCSALAESDWKKNPFKVGRSFPVYLVEIDGERRQAAFARKEVKKGAGHRGFKVDSDPFVSIEEDLYRRDLTINAMAMDETGMLFDPYGGRKDLEEKVIRAVSPHFSEDPMRALRAARFAAQLGFTIEPETIEMMHACEKELKTEPAERKFIELAAALSSPKPSLYFRNLRAAGLLGQEFPWIHALIDKTQPAEFHPEGDAYEHTMLVLDAAAAQTARPEARFAALMHDVGKGLTPPEMLPKHHGHDKAGAAMLPEIAEALRIPKKWLKAAQLVAEEHMRVKRIKEYKKMRDVLAKIYGGPLPPEDFAAIIRADGAGRPQWFPPVRFIEEHERCFAAMKEAGREAAEELKKHHSGTVKDLAERVREAEIEGLRKALEAAGRDREPAGLRTVLSEMNEM